MKYRMTWAQRRVLMDPALAGRVAVGAGPHDCWEWQGCRVRAGYGRLRAAGKTRWAHRWARFVAFGDEPAAVCHSCDNPPCINPEHLRAGTLSDNTAEMWGKGRARVAMSLLDADFVALMAELDALPARLNGRRAQMDRIAERYGTSVRTLYRLLNERETPLVYRPRISRAVTHGTQNLEDIAA